MRTVTVGPVGAHRVSALGRDSQVIDGTGERILDSKRTGSARVRGGALNVRLVIAEYIHVGKGSLTEQSDQAAVSVSGGRVEAHVEDEWTFVGGRSHELVDFEYLMTRRRIDRVRVEKDGVIYLPNVNGCGQIEGAIGSEEIGFDLLIVAVDESSAEPVARRRTRHVQVEVLTIVAGLAADLVLQVELGQASRGKILGE